MAQTGVPLMVDSFFQVPDRLEPSKYGKEVKMKSQGLHQILQLNDVLVLRKGNQEMFDFVSFIYYSSLPSQQAGLMKRTIRSQGSRKLSLILTPERKSWLAG